MEAAGGTVKNDAGGGSPASTFPASLEKEKRKSILFGDLAENMVGAIGEYSDAFTYGIFRFCYDWFYSKGWFWCLTTALILVEPILCSYDPYKSRPVYKTQIAVLVVSTAAFVVEVTGATAYKALGKQGRVNTQEGDDLCETQDEKSSSPSSPSEDLRKILFTGDNVLSFFCLLCGWIFLWYRPGIAALRCFRVFRILYFHELPEGLGDEKGKGVLDSVKYGMNKIFYIFGGEKHTRLVLKVCKFASKCLQSMSVEMFFLTEQTRGGFILMVMLFYSAFVVGCSMWIETRDITLANTSCDTLGSCVFTLLRLTFYDGTGLDFLWSLSADNKFLFAIVVVYLCSTAFGILNGLIGIFGDIFNDESDHVFVQGGAKKKDVDALNDTIYKLTADFAVVKGQLDQLTQKLAELK